MTHTPIRSLIPASALFAPEQLTEVYHGISETLDNCCITPERQKLLESAEQHIRLAVSKQYELLFALAGANAELFIVY